MYSNAYLIKFLLNSDNYVRYYELTPESAFESEYLRIFKSLAKYHEQTSEPSLEDFELWSMSHVFPLLSDDNKKLHTLYIRQIHECLLSEDSSSEVIKFFLSQKARRDLVDHLRDGYNHEKVSHILDSYNEAIEKLNGENEGEYQDNTLERVLISNNRAEGLKWRLNFLNNNLGHLIPGDFGVVAAAPNTGKTGWLVSEGTYIASQLPKEQCVLWFNTEGPEDAVRLRMWTSVCGVTEDQLRLKPGAAKEFYANIYNGDLNKIKVVNASSMHYKKLEGIVKKHNCGLIVVDQLDHIYGFTKGTGTDVDRKEKLYQWFRGLAKGRCPIIGATQAAGNTFAKADWKDVDSEERFQKYIGLSQLYGSRIGKQGAATFIITIGKDSHVTNSRYLHIAKSKTGTAAQDKAEVSFNEKLSRYTD